MASIGLVIILFFVFLLLGLPIAFVVLGAAGAGVILMDIGPVVLIQQLFQGMNSFTYLAIPFFIMAGDIASKGCTSERLIGMINAFVGRMRGGLGVATIIACAFFGAITGSAIACVVAIGAFMMPKLLENGYPRSLVLGIITAAGTLGIMIPPSVPMLTYSLAMGTSAGWLFTAGFFPGILLMVLFCLYTVFVAYRKNIPLAGEKISMKEKLLVVKRGVWALLFPVIVLGGIYGGLATPTEAAVIALFYIVLIELLIYRKLKIQDMFGILSKSLLNSATLVLMIATAQVFGWYLTTSQVTKVVYDSMTAAFTSANSLILVMCLIFLIAGCFTNVNTVVIILGPILVAVLKYFDISLIHFGIITMLMAQIGFLTPPFGLCLFVTMKTANASMGEVSRAIIPFVLIMFFCAALLILFPQISLFLPELILG